MGESKEFDKEFNIVDLGSKKDKNGKTYFEFWFDEKKQKRYSWFIGNDAENAQKTYDSLKKGDLIHVYWAETEAPTGGVYRNIKSLVKMEDGVSISMTHSGSSKGNVDRNYWERKDRVMTKLGVLRDAIQIFDIQQKTGDVKNLNQGMVYALAEELLDRVCQDGGFYKEGDVKEEKVE